VAHALLQGSAQDRADRHPQPRTTDRPAGAGTSGALMRVGWSPAADIDLAEWSAVGRRLGEIGRCSQWWLGDWINYGNVKFGERYSRAARLTGYDVQSLMNMVYVASRFEIYRRRENLSWSHHATVAALDVEGQEQWLTRASAEGLSVADLRVELRTQRRALEESPGGSGHAQPASDEHVLVCPNCGTHVPLSQ
jgi:hypothetical protein